MSTIPESTSVSSTSSVQEKFLAKFNQMAEAKSKNRNGSCSSALTDDDDDKNNKWCHECFTFYDKNEDGFLDEEEFTQMISDIFSPSSSTKTSSLSSSSSELLCLLDEDNDMRLGFKETRWKKWLKALMKPVSALIVVDVQNDFIDGSLALKKCPAGQDGATVVPVINQLLSSVNFDMEVYSQDWHDEQHISFIDNLHLRKLDPSSPISAERAKVYDTVIFAELAPHTQVLWPKHCVQGTRGSQLHPDLKVNSKKSIKIHKGINSNVDSYSAFFDNNRMSKTELESALRERNVTDVYVCGLAYDVCVGYTSLDAMDLGFRTYLIDDASKGVKQEDIDLTKKKLTEKGAQIVNSSQIKGLVESNVCDIDTALWTAQVLSRAKF